MKQQPKPTPVPAYVVCSICGEPWPSHCADEKGDVSTLECVRLLKAKLATRPLVVTQPYPVYPWRQPMWWSGGGTVCSSSHTTYTQAINAASTPVVVSATRAA